MPQSVYVIGIDEVGRGPLAGPVVVCALAIRGQVRRNRLRGIVGMPLRDSKKLSEKQREAWCAWIKTQSNIMYALARVYPKTIDRINISASANLAATRACMRLCRKLKVESKTKVLLDGGLYLRLKTLVASGYTLNPKTVVRGDELHLPIMLASIVAKVVRDQYMQKLHKQFPEYEFAAHKGYGTRAHYHALKKHGASLAHRKSFLKNFDKLAMFDV